jgi:hypothetical protein
MGNGSEENSQMQNDRATFLTQWFAMIALLLVLNGCTLLQPAPLPEEKREPVKDNRGQDFPAYLHHTVLEDENWQFIASQYGLTVEQLKKANSAVRHLPELPVGHKLLIPTKPIFSPDTTEKP